MIEKVKRSLWRRLYEPKFDQEVCLCDGYKRVKVLILMEETNFCIALEAEN